jgi:hypothetical protein
VIYAWTAVIVVCVIALCALAYWTGRKDGRADGYNEALTRFDRGLAQVQEGMR